MLQISRMGRVYLILPSFVYFCLSLDQFQSVIMSYFDFLKQYQLHNEVYLNNFIHDEWFQPSTKAGKNVRPRFRIRWLMFHILAAKSCRLPHYHVCVFVFYPKVKRFRLHSVYVCSVGTQITFLQCNVYKHRRLRVNLSDAEHVCLVHHVLVKLQEQLQV